MVEEAPHEARRIERNELVQRAVRQALLGERGGAHRAGGDENGKILRAQLLDQRHRGEHLADARAVHPDERTFRTFEGGFAAPFGEPLGMLLAAAQPPRQHLRRDRRPGCGRPLIHTQRKRQTLRHVTLRRSGGRLSHRRAASPH